MKGSQIPAPYRSEDAGIPSDLDQAAYKATNPGESLIPCARNSGPRYGPTGTKPVRQTRPPIPMSIICQLSSITKGIGDLVGNDQMMLRIHRRLYVVADNPRLCASGIGRQGRSATVVGPVP